MPILSLATTSSCRITSYNVCYTQLLRLQAASAQDDGRPQADSLEPDAARLQEPVLPAASFDVPEVAESQAELGMQADWQSKASERRAPLEFEGFSSLDADPEPVDIDTENSVVIMPADAVGEWASYNFV